MDAQSRASETAALAAVVQCLVRRHAGAVPGGVIAAEVLEENRFIAARDGMQGRLIDPETNQRRPVVDLVRRMLAACAPQAARLGCEDELRAAAALAAFPGAERQRRHAGRDGLEDLPRRLAGEFLRPARERDAPSPALEEGVLGEPAA